VPDPANYPIQIVVQTNQPDEINLVSNPVSVIEIKSEAASNINVLPATVNITEVRTNLPPATANTLGGIIVGDNLTINANGLLSAQAGGVSTFNNRTGNVTLTANDVTTIANDLYAKESSQNFINLGDGLVPLPIREIGPVGNATAPLYGIISNQTISNNYGLGNGTHINFIGLRYGGGFGGNPYIAKWHKNTNGTESQTALYLDYGVNFSVTTWTANVSLVSDIYFFTSSAGLTFGLTTSTQFTSFEMTAADGVFFYSVAQGINNISPGFFELLTKGAADRLYQPIRRVN
jgi:hypothetical protein